MVASTTVRQRTNNEQQQLLRWIDNDELNYGTTTSNNFLADDFVTYDADEFFREPQSPSAILDSLDDNFVNSSNDQDGLSVSSSMEDITGFSIQRLPPEQTELLPVFLRTIESEPRTGSISHSELLKLEGISLKSPRGNTTAPASPPSLQQPKILTERGQFVDSVQATFRRAMDRTRTSGATDVVLDEHNQNHSHQSPNYEYITDLLDLSYEQIDNNGLSLSPPLTTRIPYSGSYTNNIPFVSGNIEDPFYDKILGLPISSDPNTSMSTPATNDDFFLSNIMPDLNCNNLQVHQPKIRNTSSAEWPTGGIINDEASCYDNSKNPYYIPDKSALHSPGLWEDSLTPSSTSGHSPVSENAARTTTNRNNEMHQQQPKLPCEYTPRHSNFMIHKLKPQQPQSARIATNIPEKLMTHTHHYPHSSHYHPSHWSHSTKQKQQQHYHHHQRPYPRTPSSGASRYHGSSKSSSHHSPPRGMLTHRQESVSPCPSPHHRLRRTTSSSSISVRKQRSWSRAPQTSEPPSRSGSFRGRTVGDGGDGGDGGGNLGGFVNYTPNDKKVLMTGVAPSGSSKTKARREKEAADRRRKLSEAAVKAVQAAGGDIDKLVREGFDLQYVN